MNLATLRDQAAKFAGDRNITRYTSDDYLTAINRAQEQFVMDTRSLWSDTSWTSTSGVAAYALPSDFMWEKSVSFNGLPLSPITRIRLGEINAADDWTDDAGTPTNYIVDPEEATKQILLYPIPQDGDASKTIAMRYYPLPAALAADSDIPLNSSALMSQFHLGLAAFAAWLLLTSEQMTPEILQKRSSLMSIYSDSVTKAVDTFKNTASAPIRMRGSRPVA